MFARLDIVTGTAVGVFLSRPALVGATEDEVEAGLALDRKRAEEIAFAMRAAACTLSQCAPMGNC